MRKHAFVWIFLAAMTVSACTENAVAIPYDQTPPDDTCTGDNCPCTGDDCNTPECSLRNPCADPNKTCNENGVCVDKDVPPECSAQKPCADPNKTCNDYGVCVTKDVEPECSPQKPCADPNKECNEYGVCVEKGVEPECSPQNPCAAPNKECNAYGVCVDKDVLPECSAQTPCADPNKECNENGVCVDKDVTPECSAQTPCADPNKECNAYGVCVDKPQDPVCVGEDCPCTGDNCSTEQLPEAEADLLDVVFLKDGTAKDVSKSNLTVQYKGTKATASYDETLKRYVAHFSNAMGEMATEYYRIDYSDNQDFKNKIADGHSLESVFCMNAVNDGSRQSKPFSSHDAGGTGLMMGMNSDQGGKGMTFLPHVGGNYIWATSGITPKVGNCYHVIGTWNKEKGKASVYINGKLRNTVPAAGDFKLGNAPWFGIGGDPTVDKGAELAFNGDVAIARIYSDPLSAAQVEELYNRTNLATLAPYYNPETRNKTAFRLSSISDEAMSSGKTWYKVFAPYTDQYTLNCPEAYQLEVWDSEGNLLASGSSSLKVTLNKNEQVYINITTTPSKAFLLEVTPTDHSIELPFEINTTVDPASFSVNASSSADPLKPAELKYTKRTSPRAMYVYSNSPETLSVRNINTCLTSNDITDKDVFFTFEHNDGKASGNPDFYYGYRVTNTGSDDLYITVKNLGLQTGGKGTWLGEDEWIKFYNISFRTDVMTQDELKTFNDYFGFSNQYNSENRKPITYRIPAGKYIYVMGGMPVDSENIYKNINVFSSAGKKAPHSCSNGAVMFSTYGSKAKGEFVVYNDVNKLNNSIKSSPQNGYDMGEDDTGHVTIGHIGYDDFYGVVDADLVWTFNDATPSGDLPVHYSNPYYLKNKNETGTPFDAIPASSFTTQNYDGVTTWQTHITPNSCDSVGTDMVDFHTIRNDTKASIVADYKHYDKTGKAISIGNWMTDYIDTITLVNQGNKERTFTYKLKPHGAIVAFVRDENGFISDTYSPRYAIDYYATGYTHIVHPFEYSVKVPAHSVKQFSVNYNLLANSYGTIDHSARLE